MQQTAAAVLQSWSPPGRSHYVHRVQAAGSRDRGSAENGEESGGNGTHQLLNTEYKYFSFSPRLYKYLEGGIKVETDSGCSVHFINQAFSDVFCAFGFSADSQPW